MPVEQRGEQRRLARAVRPDEADLLAALDDHRRAVEELLVAGGEPDVLDFEHDAAAPWWVEEVEAERAALLRQRLDLVACLRALRLEPRDLRQLGLRLLRLRLLVAEPLDEALEPRDVDGHAIRRLPGCRGPRRPFLPPLVPRPREVVRAARGELEHGGRDRFEEPAVVRDENDRRVDRLELALEPLEVLHVEVVRRLVEEEEIRASRKSARERRARQLPAGERAERPVELVVGEAEAAHGRCGAIAPGPAARVLEPGLRLRVAPQRRVVVRRRRPSPARAAAARPRPRAGHERPRARTRGALMSNSSGGRWSWSATRAPFGTRACRPGSTSRLRSRAGASSCRRRWLRRARGGPCARP